MKKIIKKSMKLLFLFCILGKEKRAFFLSIMLLGFQTLAISQTKKVDYTISYDVETIEFKKPKKGEANYSDIEKLEFTKKIKILEHFDITVFNNGDEEVTITHINSNRAPDWFTQPAKTVIDDKGVRTYDKDGKELVNLEHSQVRKRTLAENRQNNLSKKKHDITKLKKPTQSEIDQLIADGTLVKQIGGGKLHMKKGNKEILCDVDNQDIEEREFENNELKTLRKKRISSTKDNYNYVSLFSEVALEKGSSNRKMYRFINRNTSNYVVKQVLGIRSAIDNMNETGNLNFSISPNPTIDNISVQIPVNADNKSARFFIIDMVGKIVLQENLQPGIRQLSVKNLPAGIYIAQLYDSDEQKQSIRFVKQ